MAIIAKSAEERIHDAYCKKYWHLDLARPELTTIPPGLEECAHLESLDRYFNDLTELPAFLGRFARLRDLNIAGNRLTALPKLIGGLSGLKRLDVFNTDLIDHRSLWDI